MNWKKVAYAVAPVLLAGGLYLSGSDVLAKTITKLVAVTTTGQRVRAVFTKDYGQEFSDEGYIYIKAAGGSGDAQYDVYKKL